MNLNGFILPFLSYSSCNSTNCIYILKCKVCKDTYYIGETDTFKRRFYKHCNDIKNFIPFYVYTCVSTHFNQTNHSNFNLNEILCFYIFHVDAINNKTNRLNIENDLINLFLKLNMKLLNFDIPNKYNIKFNI